ERVLAITMSMVSTPATDRERAVALARGMGVAHEVIELPFDAALARNPRDRCYLCKTRLFSQLRSLAAKRGYAAVLEGSNADDLKDHRPGLVAVRELGVLTPLADAGLSKDSVRMLARSLGLSNWNSPSSPCLLTRLPYGAEVRVDHLRRIDAAEGALRAMGFREFRVRGHGELARIELAGNEQSRLLVAAVRSTVRARLQTLGFSHVTVDLEPYRSGSFDRIKSAGELA
ncbi:MAG: ATP-dependent sacrificial sulfur transferase LarE, partial [Burkholderiaceae bacterium]